MHVSRPPHSLTQKNPKQTKKPKKIRHNTEHDGPYWRGPVWVNVNYLALRALRAYSTSAGPHAATARALHDELRSDLLATLAGQYGSTGYLWEQYDERDGRGVSSHPFTGWTALLALVAAELY